MCPTAVDKGIAKLGNVERQGLDAKGIYRGQCVGSSCGIDKLNIIGGEHISDIHPRQRQISEKIKFQYSCSSENIQGLLFTKIHIYDMNLICYYLKILHLDLQ